MSSLDLVKLIVDLALWTGVAIGGVAGFGIGRWSKK